MTTAAFRPTPNVEKWVWDAIGGPGMTSWQLDRQVRDAYWIGTHTLQIDARGATRDHAFQRADFAWRMLLSLQGSTHPDGVMGAVSLVTGPLWQPDEGTPRYVLRVAVVAHP